MHKISLRIDKNQILGTTRHFYIKLPPFPTPSSPQTHDVRHWHQRHVTLTSIYKSHPPSQLRQAHKHKTFETDTTNMSRSPLPPGSPPRPPRMAPSPRPRPRRFRFSPLACFILFRCLMPRRWVLSWSSLVTITSHMVHSNTLLPPLCTHTASYCSTPSTFFPHTCTHKKRAHLNAKKISAFDTNLTRASQCSKLPTDRSPFAFNTKEPTAKRKGATSRLQHKRAWSPYLRRAGDQGQQEGTKSPSSSALIAFNTKLTSVHHPHKGVHCQEKRNHQSLKFT